MGFAPSARINGEGILLPPCRKGNETAFAPYVMAGNETAFVPYNMGRERSLQRSSPYSRQRSPVRLDIRRQLIDLFLLFVQFYGNVTIEFAIVAF